VRVGQRLRGGHDHHLARRGGARGLAVGRCGPVHHRHYRLRPGAVGSAHPSFREPIRRPGRSGQGMEKIKLASSSASRLLVASVAALSAAALGPAQGCSSVGSVLSQDAGATDAGPGAGGLGAGAGGARTGAGGAPGGSGGVRAGSGGAPAGSGGAAAGSGGMIAAGTGGAVAVPGCPATVPAPQSNCSQLLNGRICYYENCSAGGAGRSTANCTGGLWNVLAGPCTQVSCMGMTCPAGQICYESAGGALLVSCVPNTCGTGPISCDCLSSCISCPGASVSGSVNGGVTILCNTCPTNTCA